jgi:hypothetical protein
METAVHTDALARFGHAPSDTNPHEDAAETGCR